MSPRLSRRDWLAAVGAVVFVESRAFTARADDAVSATAQPALGRFTTSYETDAAHRPRAVNVGIAAAAIDGAVIPAGGPFSFNDVVGERTAANGYERSVVLRRRMLAEGSGGGTCQVASTLHAAALLAGLDVVERAAHSRPTAYIRVGLDATVEFGTVDLKLRNPRRDRVVVRTRATRGSLDVWIEADSPPHPHVSLTTEIIERSAYTRSTIRDARVSPGEAHVREYGIPGYRVIRTRAVVDADGTRSDVVIDVYPPVPEVLVAHPSFDLTRLSLSEAEDTPEGRVTPARLRAEAGVRKPALVQLRPTTRVVLDNAP